MGVVEIWLGSVLRGLLVRKWLGVSGVILLLLFELSVV